MVRKLVALRLVHGNVPPETAVASVFRESEQESELIMSTTCLSKPVITCFLCAKSHAEKETERMDKGGQEKEYDRRERGTDEDGTGK